MNDKLRFNNHIDNDCIQGKIPSYSVPRFARLHFQLKNVLPESESTSISNRSHAAASSNVLKEKWSSVVDGKLDSVEIRAPVMAKEAELKDLEISSKKIRCNEAHQLFELELQEKQEEMEHRRKVRAL